MANTLSETFKVLFTRDLEKLKQEIQAYQNEERIFIVLSWFFKSEYEKSFPFATSNLNL